jgi:hypothetical protein
MVTNLLDAGPGSLRQALLDTPRGGTVDFAPGLSGAITLTTGELLVDKDLVVAGPGADVITVSGNQASRVFTVAATNKVTLAGLTIADGVVSVPQGSVSGGGVWNAGILTITACVLDGNTVNAAGVNGSASGGGIANYGRLTITGATLSGNSAHGFAAGFGGAIANWGWLSVTASSLRGNAATGTLTASGARGGGIYNAGTLTVTGCTLSGNTVRGRGAGSDGAGIYNAGTLAVAESTLSGNAGGGPPGLGGGLYNGGTLNAIDCTLSGNSVSLFGGGLYNAVANAAALRNTLLTGNTGLASPDVAGILASQGHNLVGDGSGSSGWVDTDLVGSADNPADPLLGPLQDNGGPTQTMAPRAGSPALNTGDPEQLGSPDQRGVVRTGGVNIGAYQASATAFLVSAPRRVRARVPFDVTVTAVDPFGQVAVGYTGTVTFSTSDPRRRVVLPADYAFTLGDGGVHTFTDTGRGETTLRTRGHHIIVVADTADGSITGQASVRVRRPRPAPRAEPGRGAVPAPSVPGEAFWLGARVTPHGFGQSGPLGSDWLDAADLLTT